IRIELDRFRKHPTRIAGEFYDAALVLGDFALNDFATDFFQLRKRSGFIASHQPAVTDDVGCQNRGEATFHGAQNTLLKRIKQAEAKKAEVRRRSSAPRIVPTKS